MTSAPEVTTEAIMVGSAQAARLCGVARSTFLGWDAAGLCPKPIRIGGRVLWSTEDLRLFARWGAPGRETFEAKKAALEGGR